MKDRDSAPDKDPALDKVSASEMERLMTPSEPQMLNVIEMSEEEMTSLLTGSSFGHLGCSRFDKPYVVPIHYVYAGSEIYIYTTRGMKTEMLDHNSQVCLQVEEVKDSHHWKSVIVTGYAGRIDGDAGRQYALNLIGPDRPDLAPAMAQVHFGEMLRSNSEVIYKITVHHRTGRKTR